MRALREGEVMGAYMEFDRTADRGWTAAEYLVRYGMFISEQTIKANEASEQCGHVNQTDAGTNCM